MKLRTRISLLVGAAVAVTVLLVSSVAVVAANRQAIGAVDTQLVERARLALAGPGAESRPLGRLLDNDTVLQTINGRGEVIGTNARAQLEVRSIDIEVANGIKNRVWQTVTVESVRLRVLTIQLDDRRALMLARELTEADDGVTGLRNVVLVVAGIGVFAAACIGWLVGERAMRPVLQLSTAASRVAETEQLDQPIDIDRSDELGDLARNFNSMLTALTQSREQQHRLVTDASHELRTPLTSLRTNVELLQRASARDDNSELAEVRQEIMGDVVFELGELTALVSELVELATDRHQAGNVEPIPLAEVVERVADRHRRRTDSPITVEGSASVVLAVPALVERAVSNLVHNAVKFSPAGSPIEISTIAGEVRVRDHGPGIAPDERMKVFERFYRSDAARAQSGSGLGLSIVAHVAATFDGQVWIEDPPDAGAGTVFVLRLPIIRD
ncbi:MAG: two-component system sensor histidine kinase MprB [Candidatus Poriferisodalaceae bacterium]